MSESTKTFSFNLREATVLINHVASTTDDEALRNELREIHGDLMELKEANKFEEPKNAPDPKSLNKNSKRLCLFKAKTHLQGALKNLPPGDFKGKLKEITLDVIRVLDGCPKGNDTESEPREGTASPTPMKQGTCPDDAITISSTKDVDKETGMTGDF